MSSYSANECLPTMCQAVTGGKQGMTVQERSSWGLYRPEEVPGPAWASEDYSLEVIPDLRGTPKDQG